MSDHLQLSTSSSPGRASSISRPAWPWQVSTLRNSASSLSASSSESRNLTSGSPRPTSIGSGSLQWQAVPNSRSASTMGNNAHRNNIQEDTIRQWSFTGFEWTVRDVHRLRDFVEGVDAQNSENSEFEILKQSHMLGDNKFKLEIAFTPPSDGSSDSNDKSALSLYITSLMDDFAHADYELSASMMTAIKCQADRLGERGAPPEWVWDFWQLDWVFRHEHEVWECPLPPLSALLENERIRATDSFVISVQIHCPSGPSYPQQPAVHSVPKDLLDGLEASLDNPNTGDVRFICLERQPPPSPLVDSTSLTSRKSSSSSYAPFSSRTTVRKRVIYAHSDILSRRSEYFATMLASSFSENPTLTSGERKIYTIIVEEADFETIYWLLKFCYTNWLLFREDDDPRLAMDGVGVGWSAKWLHTRGGEWDWKTFQRDDSATNDTRSVTSGDSIPSVVDAGGSSPRTEILEPVITTSATPTPASSSGPRNPPTTKGPSTSRAGVSSPRRPIPPSAIPSTSNVPSSSRTKPVSIMPVSPTSSPSSRIGYPISPITGRQHPLSPVAAPDPHLHPTPTPRPASALSVYQVAHRYAMPNLATLALDHMMSTITPQSSFALLLASSVWEELHSLVEDYVVEKWDEVSLTEEFEQCCQEVAAGEWGPEGGKTVMCIFRRLRSPGHSNS